MMNRALSLIIAGILVAGCAAVWSTSRAVAPGGEISLGSRVLPHTGLEPVAEVEPMPAATIKPTLTTEPTASAAPSPMPSATETLNTETPSGELIYIPGTGNVDLSDLLLPDLQALPPYDLRYIINDNTGKRHIRFSNAVWNSGEGDFEIFGEMNADDATIDVTQVISSTLGFNITQSIGQFVFHDVHDHWHWEGFSQYEVWSVHPNMTIDQKLAISGKVSYCVRDNDPITVLFPEREPPPGTPLNKVYTNCGWQHQGLSVGWIDIYKYNLAGQSIDITDLTDGIYALVSIADPDGMLLEENENNNAAMIYFEIRGRKLTSFEP